MKFVQYCEHVWNRQLNVTRVFMNFIDLMHLPKFQHDHLDQAICLPIQFWV